MYTMTNYKNKKAIKGDIAAGKEIRIFQFNDIFHNLKGARDYTGSAALEGPHYPAPHTWHATAQLVDGKVVSIK